MNGHNILTDTHDETTYHERATALLDEIAAQARTALREAGICLNVFFIVPPEETEARLRAIVSAIDHVLPLLTP